MEDNLNRLEGIQLNPLTNLKLLNKRKISIKMMWELKKEAFHEKSFQSKWSECKLHFQIRKKGLKSSQINHNRKRAPKKNQNHQWTLPQTVVWLQVQLETHKNMTSKKYKNTQIRFLNTCFEQRPSSFPKRDIWAFSRTSMKRWEQF